MYCIKGKCQCFLGWYGKDCSDKACLNNCTGNGRCAEGKCFCDLGYSGIDCSQKECLKDCGKNGKCVNDFYSFSPDNNELIKHSSMLKERCSHSMIHIGIFNEIFVVGGYSNNTCERYIINEKKFN